MERNQITMVVSDKLNKAIERAATAKGLKKAPWIRQLIIEKLEGLKNGQK